MGFNILDYKEPLSKLDLQETGKWINADGIDPYSYAGGDDEYNYAGGTLSCDILHPIRKKEREACYKARAESSKESESDVLLAKAALAKATQPQVNTQMSPLAITGIIAGSLLAITVMVVVIKKVKAKRA
jgi:hypothetical protein